MSDFDVRYDLTAGAAAAVDDCAGLRVFISPNGSPNSWVAITGLDKNITTGPQSGNVLLAPPIANNQTFYLLWVDDNDDGDTDPAYTIDNLAIEMKTTQVGQRLHRGGGSVRRRHGRDLEQPAVAPVHQLPGHPDPLPVERCDDFLGPEFSRGRQQIPPDQCPAVSNFNDGNG